MDELFCDQSKAYQSASATSAGTSALSLYEQLKEAIEEIEKTLREDENLLTTWQSPAGNLVRVEHIGYYNQTLMVFCGRDSEGAECTAIVPVQSAQLVLKKLTNIPGEVIRPVSFIGHSVTAIPPGAPTE